MKRILSVLLIFALAALCVGCGSAQAAPAAAPEPEQPPEATPAEEAPVSEQPLENKAESEEVETMRMRIGETDVEVVWEENEAVEALRELARSGLRIEMSMYGGFEQVGPIGKSLPRDDRQISTQSGDIVLYSGNQLVVFYGSNSWAYTRLGKIVDKTSPELSELLGNGDVSITITLDNTGRNT